jgi:hypothetical protein
MENTHTIKEHLANVPSLSLSKYVGGYSLGEASCTYTFMFTYKPIWFHRFFMKLCFGFRWVDKNKEEIK